MQTEDIVSGWRNGADNVDGYENPAGPLYIGGADAVEAALTSSGNPSITMNSLTAVTCRPSACCVCA